MVLKIENLSTLELSKKTQAHLKAVLESLPREHLRGIEKLRLVDVISETRVKMSSGSAKLPGLYYPRQGTQQAYIEIALKVLLPAAKPFYKQLLPKLSLKGNLAALIFSLVGQHYYMTLRHSVKKGQLEPLVRSYTENQLKIWQQKENHLRARLFKPLQPTLERWSKALQKRAATNKKTRRAN
jgi:hypothetical protein